jgi:hypothetical protein
MTAEFISSLRITSQFNLYRIFRRNFYSLFVGSQPVSVRIYNDNDKIQHFVSNYDDKDKKNVL